MVHFWRDLEEGKKKRLLADIQAQMKKLNPEKSGAQFDCSFCDARNHRFGTIFSWQNNMLLILFCIRHILPKSIIRWAFFFTFLHFILGNLYCYKPDVNFVFNKQFFFVHFLFIRFKSCRQKARKAQVFLNKCSDLDMEVKRPALVRPTNRQTEHGQFHFQKFKWQKIQITS